MCANEWAISGSLLSYARPPKPRVSCLTIETWKVAGSVYGESVAEAKLLSPGVRLTREPRVGE